MGSLGESRSAEATVGGRKRQLGQLSLQLFPSGHSESLQRRHRRPRLLTASTSRPGRRGARVGAGLCTRTENNTLRVGVRVQRREMAPVPVGSPSAYREEELAFKGRS